ncbi:MAG: hypothetical protein U0946_01000 [Patescibacteria group bacterium]|nr:hypothetical protein [Patescibacteria group bacterium]
MKNAVLEKDTENSVILIERVKPGKLLSTLNNDEQETRILVKMIRNPYKRLIMIL